MHWNTHRLSGHSAHVQVILSCLELLWHTAGPCWLAYLRPISTWQQNQHILKQCLIYCICGVNIKEDKWSRNSTINVYYNINLIWRQCVLTEAPGVSCSASVHHTAAPSVDCPTHSDSSWRRNSSMTRNKVGIILLCVHACMRACMHACVRAWNILIL